MDEHLFPDNFAQHHKVIQIPMQDGWEAQFVKFIKLQTHRTRAKFFFFGNARKRGQRDALERYRVAAAQRGEVGQRAVPT